VETADSLRSKHGIDVRIHTEAVSIDPSTHTVALRDLTTHQASVEHYDKLLLAMGAEPVSPQIPGIDLAGVVPLWSVPHVDAIAEMIARGSHSAVILGEGMSDVQPQRHCTNADLRSRSSSWWTDSVVSGPRCRAVWSTRARSARYSSPHQCKGHTGCA